MTTHPRPSNRGFTLTELLVVIGLVVLLMTGVVSVFGIASETIRVAQDVSADARAIRAVQSVIEQDMAELDRNAPLVIRGERIAAFRTRDEELADRDYLAVRISTNPTVRDDAIRSFDNDTNPADDEAAVDRFLYGQRNHRIDRLNFFMRGTYQRQTGGPTSYVTPMTSDQAYVQYGHLRQPNARALAGGSLANVAAEHPAIGHGNVGAPGTSDEVLPDVSGTGSEPRANSNNFYAPDFLLGRTRMLLKAPNAEGNVLDDSGNPSEFFGLEGRPELGEDGTDYLTGSYSLNSGPGVNFDGNGNYPQRYYPFADSAPAYGVSYPGMNFNGQMAGAAAAVIQTNRYDVAGVTIEQYADMLERNVRNGDDGSDNTETTGNGPDQHAWWATAFQYRFQGYPFPPQPLTPSGLARTVPALLPGASGYAVEFAGDFVTQNNDATDTTDDGNGVYGDVTGAAPDGVLDYVVANLGTVAQRKVTRFYGLPRDTAGLDAGGNYVEQPDGLILGNDDDDFGDASHRRNNLLVDVVPLRDVVFAGGFGPVNGFAEGPYNFERLPQVNTGNGGGAANQDWQDSDAQNNERYFALRPYDVYANAPGAGDNDAANDTLFDSDIPGGGSGPGRQQYIAAWGPDTDGEPRPWLLRHVIWLDSPDRDEPKVYEVVTDVRR